MNTDIPSRIRKRREQLGITKTELAARCGMAHARISDAEHGKGRLLVETLERIAKGLGVKMNYFFRVDTRRGRA